MNSESSANIVEAVLHRVGRRLVVATPLGLGKANVFLNALYDRAKVDSTIDLTIFTALTLTQPRASSDLERRFLDPFRERVFGGCPELHYDMERGRHPPNIRVVEFYFPAGKRLRDPEAQALYVSTNYTHVVRDLIDRGVNVVAQMVAESDDSQCFSLSCNPDITLDLIEGLESRSEGHPWALVGEVNSRLPYMFGDGELDKSRFHCVLRGSECNARLFPVPKGAVGLVDYAIGLRASSLVKDGGTLQIGIGSLGDALVHALLIRHREGETYRHLLNALHRPGETIAARVGEEGVFEKGLFAATEMFVDGFRPLYEAGILKRCVSDAQDGSEAVLHGGFFLGCESFYEWLRELPEEERRLFRMMSVRKVNHLYGDEALRAAQRIEARFFNSALMMTVFGAAVSDGLEDGRMVSGVGGQYNFVAMAHELPTARSILQIRSTRTEQGATRSNVVFNYGHTTIPRHLRDIVITEYGVADLRGKSDHEVAAAMIEIADARFQDDLVHRTREAGKLLRSYRVPDHARENRPEVLREKLRPFMKSLPSHPFGTDFTEDELVLARVLRKLKSLGRAEAIKLLVSPGRTPSEHVTRLLRRMSLESPRSFRDKVYRKLLKALLES